MNINQPQDQQKRRHEKLVLSLIRDHAPISRAQLTIDTGLSAQTISNIVRRLLEEGLVVEKGTNRSGNIGRQPILLDIFEDGAFAIGIDVETDRLVKALVNLRGEVMYREEDSLISGGRPEDVISQIGEFVRRILAREEFRSEGARLAGVGIGVPGPIDYEAGEVVSPPNLPNWKRVPLRKLVEEVAGVSVILDNSSAVSAAGESWVGRWQPKSFLYCYWGVGVGGGLVSDGRLYRGTSGNSLEFGHVTVVPNGRPCACGGIGCLEAHASIPAILQEARPIQDFQGIGELARKAVPGNEVYRILTRAIEYIGQALVTSINLLDVDLVVIGGHHVRAVENLLIPTLREYVNYRIIRRSVRPVQIAVSTLGEEAGAIGAASLVFHELLPGGTDS